MWVALFATWVYVFVQVYILVHSALWHGFPHSSSPGWRMGDTFFGQQVATIRAPQTKFSPHTPCTKRVAYEKNNQHIKTPHNYLKTISGVIVALKCLTYTTMIFYIIRFFFLCFLILVGAPVWNPARCLDTYGVLEEFGVQLTADDFYQRCSVGWCNVGWKHDIYDRYMVIYVDYVAHTLTQIYNDIDIYIVLI